MYGRRRGNAKSGVLGGGRAPLTTGRFNLAEPSGFVATSIAANAKRRYHPMTRRSGVLGSRGPEAEGQSGRDGAT
jgi:hypothetical protein